MKIVAISDQHGGLPDIPECDMLLIAGDICPLEKPLTQLEWMDTRLRHWLNKMKWPVFACAGNHDWPMFTYPDRVAALKLPWVYLQDSGAEYKGLNIWGSPWQRRFYDWAFNLEEIQLAGKWNLIPDNTDILITHSPPKYYGDRVDGDFKGSEFLTIRLKEVKPKLHVFGHIHCGRGSWQMYDETMLANVAMTDGKYNLVHDPFVYELAV